VGLLVLGFFYGLFEMTDSILTNTVALIALLGICNQMGQIWILLSIKEEVRKGIRCGQSIQKLIQKRLDERVPFLYLSLCIALLLLLLVFEPFINKSIDKFFGLG